MTIQVSSTTIDAANAIARNGKTANEMSIGQSSGQGACLWDIQKGKYEVLVDENGKPRP